MPGRPTICIAVGQWPTAGVLCCAGVQINIQTFRVESFRSLVDHCRILKGYCTGFQHALKSLEITGIVLS